MGDQLRQALSDLEEERVLKLVQEQLDADEDPLAIIGECREGLADVGRRYQAQEYFVSDLIMAGEVFKQAMTRIGTKFQTDSGPKLGSVVIGTVRGDIHDIGKDIVVSLLQASNYDVVDVGVDAPPDKFVQAARTSAARVVGLSGLLTISFDAMKETVDALKKAGLPVKVMIGGGPVTEQVRAQVGADAFGADAQSAVALCNLWMKG